MLKKRYSAKTMGIIMTSVALGVAIALYLMKLRLGISHISIIIMVILAGCGMTFITISLTKGREAVVVDQPTDYPPEGINPIQAGCIIDGNVNDRDIVAGFYYLGERRYMDIIEFELKRFEFRANMFPVSEDRDIQILFRAIFGAEICSLFGENGKLKAETGEKQLTVRLDDAASRLIEIVPAVKTATFRKISRKKNREIADLTGKIRGFRQSLTDNRGDKAAALVDADPGYVYRVLPYAYCFAMTSKLSSNFNHISIEVPEWYFPYGVGEDYVMDVVIYSAMLRNLPEELKTLVFENIELLRKVNL